MTIYDKLKSKSIDEFAEWLDKYGAFDGSEWNKWFDKNYCQKCEGVKVIITDDKAKDYGLYGEHICSYCEVEHKCRFSPDINRELDNIDVIKLWLRQNI